MNAYKKHRIRMLCYYSIYNCSPGGYSSEFVVGGVPSGSPTPDLISDQNMPFSTPVFRPSL